ncbi:metal cation symporter ZIP8-like [Panonychus citri]|uniref:metal cation symporter ZIP8-like n=1 Tax=Panonychus citri TaxID=50023 RepID=UPI0023073CE5|nr:metal cation symporter ZIP8-like [Panonychus citri]
MFLNGKKSLLSVDILFSFIVFILISSSLETTTFDRPPLWNRSDPILDSNRDVEILTAFILVRGHIVIGPESEMDLDSTVLDKLITHLYKLQRRSLSPSGLMLYPAMEERDLGCESLPSPVSSLCSAVTKECLSAADMISMMPKKIVSLHQALTRLCPLILFRQTRVLCEVVDSHAEELLSASKKPILVEPSSEKVWAFAILFVTLSIVVSMGGLILLPFLHRDHRRTILTLFEGLAAGGLAGSAVLHLFPQAFGIADDDYRKYFWKTFLIFAGIYSFYIIERLLKLVLCLKTRHGSRGRRRRNSSFRDEIDPISLLSRSATLGSPPGLASGVPRCFDSPNTETEILETLFTSPTAHTDSPKFQMDAKLATIRDPITLKSITVQDMGPASDLAVVAAASVGGSVAVAGNLVPGSSSLATDIDTILRKQAFVSDMAGRRKDQYTSTRAIIDAAAWMIVLGDASLNFIDGLSIGAAFDRNILAGISISVAVMLEEVPHRLGTFAVLIRAGMEMKQGFFWIFVSACTLYPGLILGIFLGDAAEEESPYIFALAGGMFLYMALVDVMREMNRSMENAIRKGIKSSLQILALQNAGIAIAILCLSVLALYEKDMDFEAVEIEELTQNALQ